MRKRIIFLAILLLISFRGQEFSFKIPKNWDKTHYDFSKNPLTPEKIELGRMLFYDPILSRNSTVSCANCHLQFTAFTHVDHALSHGIDDRIGTRNSPALMNLAWHSLFMWDGAINHLDMQALAPIHNPLEMDNSIENVVAKLRQAAVYRTQFSGAFGDSAITGERTLKAIAQFMLTLVSAESKYDSVQRGEQVFSAQEQRGYDIYRKHCSVCHTEPLFTNLHYENNGLPVDSVLQDYGRMRITQNSEDSLKFKVPTLRNIEFSAPYMHDGRFKRLNDVYKHYTSGIQPSRTLSEHLQKPIALHSSEKVDLTAFLLTLSDRNFLFNPKFSDPKRAK